MVTSHSVTSRFQNYSAGGRFGKAKLSENHRS